jgi:hypothetical protein
MDRDLALKFVEDKDQEVEELHYHLSMEHSSPLIVGTPSSLTTLTLEGMCATHIEREEHSELQVLEKSLDCAPSLDCHDHGPFLLESSLEVMTLAEEEIVEHIPCGLGREEIYPYLDWVDRYMTYMETLWDTGSFIINRVLVLVTHR